MDGFAAVDYAFAREVLQRGIAGVYLVAFISSLNQFRALCGERGLLAAPYLLDWVAASPTRRRMLRPTLFRSIRYTDRRLALLCWGGIVLAALLVAGVPQLAWPWVPMACFLLLWLGYMSIVSIGQDFYGFGWEMLLLEAGFLAAFLGSAHEPPPTVTIVLFWWLLFRLEFGAGMIKMRGGREWRDLTALMYHHETQPMPGPLSRQAHLLPAWFHRGEVLGNHVAQLIVPWFVFAPLLSLLPVPEAVADAAVITGSAAAAIIIASQLWLIVTGNFAWLNVLTVIVACSAFGLPGPRAGDELPLWWLLLTAVVGGGCLALSWPALRNLCSRGQLMNASFNRWQIANAYGAFGTVTTERIEWIVEGTLAEAPGQDDWVEYPFKGKPGDVRRRPRQFAPYHLRLDWMMWFLPLGRSFDEWFQRLLVRLLEADAATLALLRADPFDGRRPRWVRVVSYRYRYAPRGSADGAVWVRDRPELLVEPLRLDGVRRTPRDE